MASLGPTDRVRCPVDEFDFRPYYSDGECPICRWRPDQPVAQPWWVTADPVVAAFVAAVVAAAVMVVVVVVAYTSA